MKNLLQTYLLLFAFFLLAFPKGLSHSHEDHMDDHQEVSHVKAKYNIESDCFVCDFVLSPATEARQLTFQFDHLDYFVSIKSSVDFYGIQLVDELSLRGPPVQIS